MGLIWGNLCFFQPHSWKSSMLAFQVSPRISIIILGSVLPEYPILASVSSLVPVVLRSARPRYKIRSVSPSNSSHTAPILLLNYSP